MMKISRRELLKLSTAGILVAGFPCIVRATHVGEVGIYSGPAFGSRWRLVMAHQEDAPHAIDIINTVVARVDGLMSPFRADSELGRFNDANISAGRTVSAETMSVTRTALDIANASEGAFDPTVAPMSRRFGFGPTSINTTRPAGHYSDLRLGENKIKTVRPGLSLDLCGIAKGHALDEISNELDGLDFLLELGGEIAARGNHPSGRAWRMGIESPGGKKLQRIINWNGRALATSGNGAEGYVFSGRNYGHVIDPRTAMPVDDRAVQVSVLAPTARLADALATAALVLGPDASHKMLGVFDASALFIIRDNVGDSPAVREVDVLGFNRGQG